MAREDPDLFLLVFFMSLACIMLHCMRRALANWAIQTLTEAGEGNHPLIKFFERISSPWLLIPLGIYFMGMSALTYGGTVKTVLPWWLCVYLGFEAFVDGVDNLLRRLRW